MNPTEQAQITFVGVEPAYRFVNRQGEDVNVPARFQFIRPMPNGDGDAEVDRVELVAYSVAKFAKARGGQADTPEVGDQFIITESFVRSRRNPREVYTVLESTAAVE